ncbi:MAG: hypothetical protein ACKPKO_22865, partial [Candidatus Fonsibacter sp.]
PRCTAITLLTEVGCDQGQAVGAAASRKLAAIDTLMTLACPCPPLFPSITDFMMERQIDGVQPCECRASGPLQGTC